MVTFEENKALFKKYLVYHEKSYQYRFVEQLYIEINAQAVRVKSFTKELEDKTHIATMQVREISQKVQSDRIKVYYYLLCNYLYTGTKQQEILTPILRECIDELKDSKVIAQDMKGIFYHLLMINLAVLGQYEDSIRAAQNAEQFLEPKSLNWFIGKEFLVLIQLYTGKYQEALATFSETVKNKYFTTLPEFKRENWVLVEAFLNLLDRIESLEQTSSIKLKRFSYAKFINEVEYNSRDKLGYNITFQILQILFLLQTEKWDDTENRIMSTYKYAQRYLKDNEKTQRAFFFISALTQIPKGGFQRDDVAERAQKWISDMEAIDPMQTSDPFEIEIIPYHRLWEITLSLL